MNNNISQPDNHKHRNIPRTLMLVAVLCFLIGYITKAFYVWYRIQWLDSIAGIMLFLVILFWYGGRLYYAISAVDTPRKRWQQSLIIAPAVFVGIGLIIGVCLMIAFLILRALGFG